MSPKPPETIICDYPSKVVPYARLRVVFRDDTFWIQWFAGVSYPPKKTSERKILPSTARAHWNYAFKLKQPDVTAIHYTRYPKGIR